MQPTCRIESAFDLVCARVRLGSGFTVHAVSVPDLTRLLQLRMAAGRSTHVVTMNPEIDQAAVDDDSYARVVGESDVRTCDGVGIQIAARIRGGLVPPRATGVDLTEALVAAAAEHRLAVMAVGAQESVRTRFEKQLASRGITVTPGTSTIDSIPDAADRIAPRLQDRQIVLVALGAPKQELLIRELRRRSSAAAIYIGVGGTLDYLTGAVPRPAAWIRAMGIEWLYRLLLQPRRRLRRQLVSLPRFALRELLASFSIAFRQRDT